MKYLIINNYNIFIAYIDQTFKKINNKANNTDNIKIIIS